MTMKSGSCSQKGLETTQRSDDDDESNRHRGYIWILPSKNAQKRASFGELSTALMVQQTPMIAFITWISAWKLGI
jgi:hypothetical protein